MDHERIEELLAGHALRSLSGADAEAADRILAEHVPTCPLCRETLAGFQAVAGDLALHEPPTEPPDLLLPRLREGIDEPPAAPRRRRVALLTSAAAIAALVAMGTWGIVLDRRADEVSQQASMMQRAIIDGASASDARLVSLDRDLTQISVPSRRRIYLVGRGIPAPSTDRVYVLWLVRAGEAERVTEFTPDEGMVVLEFTIDPTAYDEVWITEEPPGASEPTGTRRWSASL